MKKAAGILALLALLTCLAAPAAYFAGALAEGAFKTLFLIASIVWFAGAWYWARERADEQDEEGALSALMGGDA